MNRRAAHISVAVLLVLALGATLSSSPTAAPPPVPMRIQGEARDATGSPLPIGTPIRVFIDGVDYSDGPMVRDALGSYTVLVMGDWTTNQGASETLAIKEGAAPGDTLVFAAGDFTASTGVFQETLTWQTGQIVTQELRLATSATTPAPVKIQGLVPDPAQGGNQFVFVCNPLGTPVFLGDFYLQVDRPGTYAGPVVNLTGTVPPLGQLRVDLGSTSYLNATGEAIKLVYHNPGGANAAAGGRDIVVDRVEYNATRGGTLSWSPGNTIMGDAPAPGPGRILERSPACADTDDPADFILATEPGLPPNGAPTVAIVAPSLGQTLVAGQPFLVTWLMSDDVFATSTLRVWVNVSYSGTNASLVDGESGITFVTWVPPAVEATGATVRVEVVDPLGARSNATTSFNVALTAPGADFSLYAIIAAVVGVVVASLVIAYLLERRRRPPPQQAPPLVPSGEAAEAPKICPRCGTRSPADAMACPNCGFAFLGPPRA